MSNRQTKTKDLRETQRIYRQTKETTKRTT